MRGIVLLMDLSDEKCDAYIRSVKYGNAGTAYIRGRTPAALAAINATFGEGAAIALVANELIALLGGAASGGNSAALRDEYFKSDKIDEIVSLRRAMRKMITVALSSDFFTINGGTPKDKRKRYMSIDAINDILIRHRACSVTEAAFNSESFKLRYQRLMAFPILTDNITDVVLQLNGSVDSEMALDQEILTGQ